MQKVKDHNWERSCHHHRRWQHYQKGGGLHGRHEIIEVVSFRGRFWFGSRFIGMGMVCLCIKVGLSVLMEGTLLRLWSRRGTIATTTESSMSTRGKETMAATMIKAWRAKGTCITAATIMSRRTTPTSESTSMERGRNGTTV